MNLIILYSHCINNWKEVIEEQYFDIVNSGLIHNINKIYLLTSTEQYEINNAIVQNIVLDYNDYEFPALEFIYNLAQKTNGRVLYMHSKGVSRQEPELKENITAWRKMMQYLLTYKFKQCFKALENNDCCGVNWYENPFKHYHGNFWWANFDYIRKLQNPALIKRDMTIKEEGYRDLQYRMECEKWIGKNNPQAYSIYTTGMNHYLDYINENEYKND